MPTPAAMLKRLRALLCALWRPTAESGEMLLLRWVLLCGSVAALLPLLQVVGFFAWLEEWQIILLAGDPFQMSALDAQVTLLSSGKMYVSSLALALYLGGVLLRQPRLLRRTHICLLAAAAAVLPGFMCVLWHGVLYVGQPVVCVLLLWLALVPLAAIRRFFS